MIKPIGAIRSDCVMKILHIVPGVGDATNGMVVVVNFLAKEAVDARIVDLSVVSKHDVASADEVWVHGMWLPKEWVICFRVLRAGKRLVRMTHGSLSPVYLKRQGRCKKWLVGPIERYFLNEADKIVSTCEAEKEWIQSYLGKCCPQIEVTDVKRFFKLGVRGQESEVSKQGYDSKLNILYLGRRHPLKGVEHLEKAVKELGVRRQGLGVSEKNPKLETRNVELKLVSNAFGEEKEKVWEWCDVLVLPTLSENFGLVVAEALERGKRVITTDGAPVWGEGLGVRGQELGVCVGYNGRLLYLKGYRDGSDEKRVELLKKAIE